MVRSILYLPVFEGSIFEAYVLELTILLPHFPLSPYLPFAFHFLNVVYLQALSLTTSSNAS